MQSMKQIADELQVDKQKIYRYIKKNNIIEAETKDNTKLYSDDVAKQIIENFRVAEKETPLEQEQKPTNTNDKIIDMLQSTIDILQGQLAEKDKQIDKLTNTIQTQAQSLNALNHRELAETVQEQVFLQDTSDEAIQCTSKKWYEFWK